MLRTRDVVSTLIEIVGLICIVVAAFAIDWRAGLIVVGLGLLAVGYALGVDEAVT